MNLGLTGKMGIGTALDWVLAKFVRWYGLTTEKKGWEGTNPKKKGFSVLGRCVYLLVSKWIYRTQESPTSNVVAPGTVLNREEGSQRNNHPRSSRRLFGLRFGPCA